MFDIEELQEMESVEDIIEALKDSVPEIEELRKSAESGKGMAEILADPNVRRVLEANKDGRTIRVLAEEVDDDKKNTPPERTPQEINDMTNAELLAHSTSLVTTQLGEIVSRALGEVGKRVDALEGGARESQYKGLVEEIEAVKKKYPDFSRYADDMKDLRTQNPSLGVEELYIVARSRRGDGLPGTVDTDSERATKILSRTPEGGKKKKEYKKDRRGFSEALDDVIEEIDFSGVVNARNLEGLPSRRE